MNKCSFLGHDWFQWPAGSPHIASEGTGLYECHRCETIGAYNGPGSAPDDVARREVQQSSEDAP